MQVMIGGPNSTLIGINNAGNIVVRRDSVVEQTPEVDFGPATKRNFAYIIEYFQRLSIHATDAWPNDK